jgi:hypothetical protein
VLGVGGRERGEGLGAADQLGLMPAGSRAVPDTVALARSRVAVTLRSMRSTSPEVVGAVPAKRRLAVSLLRTRTVTSLNVAALRADLMRLWASARVRVMRRSRC